MGERSESGRGWYWDLAKRKVVRWDERGPGDQVMGPYASPEAAANWRDTVEQRNEAWEEADEAWQEWGTGADEPDEQS